MSEAFAFSEPRAGLLCVRGDLRHAHARAFAELLLTRLNALAVLHVELFQVTAADLSTIQTMIVAARDARQQGKELRFTGYGLALAELVDQLAVAQELGGPLAVVWE